MLAWYSHTSGPVGTGITWAAGGGAGPRNLLSRAKTAMELLKDGESVERGPAQPMWGLESDSEHSDDGGLLGAAATIRINASAAAALKKRGELAQKQRLAAKLAGTTLSDASVRAFTKAVKAAAADASSSISQQQKAAKGDDKAKLAAVSNALRIVPPAVAATAAAASFGLPWEDVGGPPAAAAESMGPWAKLPQEAKDAALEALRGNAAAQTACKGLLRVLRRAAYASPVAGAAAGVAAAGSSAAKPGAKAVTTALDSRTAGPVGSKRRAAPSRDDDAKPSSASCSRPAAAGTGDSETDGHAPERAVKKARSISAAAVDDDTAAAAGGHVAAKDDAGLDDPEDGGEADEDAGGDADAHLGRLVSASTGSSATAGAADVAGTGGAAPVAVSTAATASKVAALKRSNKVKIHGRGAGRGRDLHPYTGEPRFEDMHPSWQAKRRLAARQAKAVHKALAAAPAPAVEVPLAAALVSGAQAAAPSDDASAPVMRK